MPQAHRLPRVFGVFGEGNAHFKHFHSDHDLIAPQNLYTTHKMYTNLCFHMLMSKPWVHNRFGLPTWWFRRIKPPKMPFPGHLCISHVQTPQPMCVSCFLHQSEIIARLGPQRTIAQSKFGTKTCGVAIFGPFRSNNGYDEKLKKKEDSGMRCETDRW